MVYLFEGGSDTSCLRDVDGAFDADGDAFVVVRDGCDVALRAWLEGGGDVVSLSPADRTDGVAEPRVAAFAGGPLFLYTYFATEPGEGAIYLSRFTAEGRRARLTR